MYCLFVLEREGECRVPRRRRGAGRRALRAPLRDPGPDKNDNNNNNNNINNKINSNNSNNMIVCFYYRPYY